MSIAMCSENAVWWNSQRELMGVVRGGPELVSRLLMEDSTITWATAPTLTATATTTTATTFPLLFPGRIGGMLDKII